MSDKCLRCLRPRYSGALPVPANECTLDATCELTRQKNVLAAALRSVLKSHDKATIRTAAVLLEEIVGASKDCPLCGHVGAVFKGYVKIHYARVSDDRPCKAAFKNVVGGIVL